MSISTSVPLKKDLGPSILLSVVLIICGLLAIALPAAMSFGISVVVAWLILFAGITQVVHAFNSSGVGHIVWKLVVAALYVAAGLYLLAHPLLGIAALAIALGIFLLAEGAVDVITFFSTPAILRSGWILVDGLVMIALGVLVWRRWPYSSLWIIGTLVGLGILMTGITRLMMALAIRRLDKLRAASTFQEHRAA